MWFDYVVDCWTVHCSSVRVAHGVLQIQWFERGSFLDPGRDLNCRYRFGAACPAFSRIVQWPERVVEEFWCVSRTGSRTSVRDCTEGDQCYSLQIRSESRWAQKEMVVGVYQEFDE